MPLDEIVVGVTPPGMVQTVALTQALQPQRHYYGLIDSGVRGYADFQPVQLRAGTVFYMGRLQTVEAFQRAARSGGKCARPISTTTVLARTAGLLGVLGAGGALATVVGRRRSTRPRSQR